MQVNTAKKGMLCISDSQNYKTRAFILDRDGVRIELGKHLKVLGWHFSEKPNPDAQVESIRKKLRQRYWVLRHLRHNGFSDEDLIKVYTAVVSPVADYMMEVYHSMLSDRQDESLERLQTHALACIFGSRISGCRMRQMEDVPTLRERRIAHCDRFGAKCAASPRFDHWFPRKEEGTRITRNTEENIEQYARCDRLYNSPIYYMRRRLNGKQGKIYGERNRDPRVMQPKEEEISRH